jgi:CheY-like chemotaxis protein
METREQVMPLLDKSILLVEDNEISRLVAAKLLKSAGANLSIAATGSMALLMAQPGAHDVIILDLDLPDMTGYEVALRIREQERQAGWEKVKIVALSADKGFQEEELSKAAGMDGIMAKPLDKDLLARILTTVNRTGSCGNAQNRRVLNIGWLEENLGDADLCRETLADALSIFPGYVKKLRDLITTSPQEAASLAHRLGGAAANIGAFALSQAAARLRKNMCEDNITLLETELQHFLQAARSVLLEKPTPKAY